MNKPSTRNDLSTAIPKFCLGLETHRRTPDGRGRSAQEFLAHFFPHDTKTSEDRIFRLMPKPVRAPILTTWGVRGKKSAALDDDAKVQSVVHDALVAGDIDAAMFETALSPDLVITWSALTEWWTFWRAGKIQKNTLYTALESAHQLELFDAEWLLASLRADSGKLRGVDVLAHGLSKDDLAEWVRNIHQSGDGSPRGLVAALGWDQIIAKTGDDVLLATLDALAGKLGLTVQATPAVTEVPTLESRTVEKKPAETAEAKAAPEGKPAAPGKPAADVKPTVEGNAAAKVEPAPAPKPEATPAPKVEPKVEAKPVEAKPAAAAPVAPKVEPKPVVRPEPKPEPATPLPPTPVAQVDAKQAGEMPTVKPPNVMLPWAGLSEEQAALAFDDKEDDLIPISAPAWEEGDEVEADVGEGVPRAARRSKPPPQKRPSRTPPTK